nr:hypothetical protein Iba_chr05fCG7910 [Ipomoea batatas]
MSTLRATYGYDADTVTVYAPIREEDHMQSDAPAIAERRGSPPVCGNAPMRSNEVEEAEQFRIGAETVNKTLSMNTDALNKDIGTPNMNIDALNKDNSAAAMHYESMEAGSSIVKHGLEELACKGISIDQFVGDAVLEAAVNIIEEAGGNVMAEEVAVKDGEGSQKDDAQEDNSSAEEEDFSQSVSYKTWVENLKSKAGEDSELMNVIEEAKREVDHFFQLALKELGKEIYDECSDEIVKKANEFFILKLEREGKEIGSRLKKELGWIEKETPATKTSESEGSSNASSKKKGRVIKTSNDWVGVAEEFMGQDKGFESKVKGALKAVNDYLWTVFDKEKNAYLEEKKIRAVRAASIFLDIVKGSPVWGAENELLGRILKTNRELIGGRICFWAEKWDL